MHKAKATDSAIMLVGDRMRTKSLCQELCLSTPQVRRLTSLHLSWISSARASATRSAIMLLIQTVIVSTAAQEATWHVPEYSKGVLQYAGNTPLEYSGTCHPKFCNPDQSWTLHLSAAAATQLLQKINCARDKWSQATGKRGYTDHRKTVRLVC